ncbi:hypothetical protein SAMD00019534_034930 [Acytostelium subglobosum LB1]|uniref:hypothetical protein n=1 Tax=Acytostelium subglobosum LB1 TaxID=1410327 RepID=UPI000644AE52|nr:hypothetical protein SAMD00019534_034930 [Acytostelium subglobosum LB1]GAM20318.1 hypothetical protein SAMD00019534_034930 [Acytostelium subglobosum LB1]|eukprot:XP_012759839.1 hypothetical protein SAMD00019534_034930 [Acytostelium subglobosum LB1]
MKNIIEDDYEDYDDVSDGSEEGGHQNNQDEEDYDDEVYEVYDTVVDALPNVSMAEIYDILTEYDFDVEKAVNHFMSKAKSNVKPKTNNNNNNNNNNNKSNNTNNNNNNNSNTNKGKQQHQQQRHIITSPSSPSSYKPSSLALNLCDVSPNAIVKPSTLSEDQFSLKSLYISGGGGDNGSGDDRIKPYTFDDPSPDDLILYRQKQAFKPSGNKQQNQPIQKNANIKQTKNASNQLIDTVKSMNIKQQSPQQSHDGRTPYNTPTSSISIPDASGQTSEVSTPQSANRNINVKQHSAARRKELEELVHNAFSTTTKPHLNMVVIGHVDAGKSTTMGHLLYKLDYVDQRTISKFEREANNMGKSSFHFAWVLDDHQEERERGVTMDVCVRYFETEHRKITLLDAPGHRDFVPNMISGTTQADVAILLINAPEFEAGFSAEGQTKEHALLAKSLGIMQLIVAINKMDMIEWSQERYNFVVETLRLFLISAKFSEKNIHFMPISGFKGENLVSKITDPKGSWYTGNTLLQQIDSFSVGERLINKPLRMVVNDVFKSSSKGSVMVGGKMEAGVMGVGDKLLISPGNEVCTVKAIRRSSAESEWAVGGDNVDLSLVIDQTNILHVGSILSDPEKPIKVAKRFLAQIVTFALPLPITNGFQAVFHAHSMEEPATITKMVSLLDGSGEVSKKNPRCVSDGMTAVVEVTLSKMSCLELYSTYRQLGRFTLRDSGKTIAAGIITEFIDDNINKTPKSKTKKSSSTSTSATSSPAPQHQ